MPTKTFLRVRSYECDSYSHVNNAVYVNYLETARMDFLNQIGFDFAGFTKAGFCIFVSKIEISYHASAFINDDLKIESSMEKLRAASGVMLQKIFKADGTLCANANVTWCCVQKDSAKPQKIPKEFMVSGLKPQKIDL